MEEVVWTEVSGAEAAISLMCQVIADETALSYIYTLCQHDAHTICLGCERSAPELFCRGVNTVPSLLCKGARTFPSLV